MYVDPVQCGYSSVKKLPRKVQSGAIHQLKSGTVKVFLETQTNPKSKLGNIPVSR